MLDFLKSLFEYGNSNNLYFITVLAFILVFVVIAYWDKVVKAGGDVPRDEANVISAFAFFLVLAVGGTFVHHSLLK